MNKWKIVTLAEVGTFQAGVGFPLRLQGIRSGQYPFAKVGDISRVARAGIMELAAAENFVDQPTVVEMKVKPLPVGTILFAKIGEAIRQNFKVITSTECLIDNNVMGLIPNKGLVEPRYLFHFLRSVDIYRLAEKTTVPSIRKSTLEKVPIPLPPLEEQKLIGEILDRAEELRSKRREAIAQLDTLTQAIFIEMFGDPVTNPKGWKIKICKSICSRITVGIVVQPASYYQEYGVPALRSQNIKQNSISTDNLVFFSQSDNETKLAKTRVKAGDVVLVRTGQPGTAAVIPEELDGVNAIDLLITTPCKDVVDSVYLCSFFNSAWGKKLVSSSQVGQIQKHLNVGILNNAQIICPPLPLQQEFARRVEAVEKLKAAHRASLSELDALFASLQHRAFRGEL